MLFEVAITAGILYFGANGQGVLVSARNAGRLLGRAAGSLRRVRAEVDRMQARAETLGGPELSKNRAEIEARLQQLRAIRAEAGALLSVHGSGGGARDTASFTDAELSAALGLPSPPSEQLTQAPPHVVLAPTSTPTTSLESPTLPPSSTRPVNTTLKDSTSALNASRLIAELGALR